MKPVKDEIQMTSFCEINANFQNVKIEIKINNLQEQARKHASSFIMQKQDGKAL